MVRSVVEKRRNIAKQDVDRSPDSKTIWDESRIATSFTHLGCQKADRMVEVVLSKAYLRPAHLLLSTSRLSLICL